MNENLAKVVEALATKASSASEGAEAQRYAQAALNVAHVMATIDCLKQPIK